MNSRERLEDCLNDEKYLSGLYNTSAHELETPELRQLALEHLQDCHRGAERVSQILKSRGWDRLPDCKKQSNTVEDLARRLGFLRDS